MLFRKRGIMSGRLDNGLKTICFTPQQQVHSRKPETWPTSRPMFLRPLTALWRPFLLTPHHSRTQDKIAQLRRQIIIVSFGRKEKSRHLNISLITVTSSNPSARMTTRSARSLAIDHKILRLKHQHENLNQNPPKSPADLPKTSHFWARH